MTTLNLCTRTFDEADSYGIIGAQLLKHLSAAGVYVNCFASGNKPSDLHSDELKPLLSRSARRADGTLILGYPTNLAKFPAFTTNEPRVIVTMWESSRCPSDWIPILNTSFGAAVTPSTFCYGLLRDGGVSAPIHVVPLGVNPVYRLAERTDDRPFTFLTFLDRRRKGGLLALTAFLMAFGGDTNYRMVLKARNPRQRVILDNANAEIMQQDMSDEELYRLYLSADVLLFPTMGEGWGLPPREFAATGGISLATDWSGTADHIDQWGWPLPYTLEKAGWEDTRFEGQELGDFAKVDPAALAEIMRHVADNREQYRLEAAQKAVFAGGYSWHRFAGEVLQIWEGVKIGDSRRLHPA